ncbi:DUF5906 domain-containing protein [Pseudobutyrivibrio sp.]
MDFYKIERRSRKNTIEIYPDFQVKSFDNLLVRGGKFYAIWDEENGLWSQDILTVQRIVDEALWKEAEVTKNLLSEENPVIIHVRTMQSHSSGSWKDFINYIKDLPDCNIELDSKLTFANTKTTKTDYVSKRLSYSLEAGDYSAWDKLVSKLYYPSEREKIEWAIGAVVSGDSKDIQKFCALYGEGGTGKSTIIKIIQKLFKGYYTTFNAKDLGSANNQFSTEAFRSDPLVAIQHDADLSRIEDNTKLNSIISHEEMLINVKGKSQYMARMNCFMFLATNKPVKITDGRSGIIRRLIDINPTGDKFSAKEYEKLMSQIDFQLGAIAYHCLEVYKSLGKEYYDSYKSVDMMLKTNHFYNFVESYMTEFENQVEGISLTQAYKMYKEYVEEAMIKAEYRFDRPRFREELKVYFDKFDVITRIDGKQVRSWYHGFRKDKFEAPVLKRVEHLEHDICADVLKMTKSESILDDILADCPAQYATDDGREKPIDAWNNVTTTLKDIDTKRLHYVLLRFPDDSEYKYPYKLIMIDFDLKNDQGEKDAKLNAEAASKWPKTYAEFSKGGSGIHLIYWYSGDISKLRSEYAPGIEIKVFRGNSSMRRRVSKCNDISIALLNDGALPLKEEKMIDIHALNDQKHLVNKIKKSLRKGDNVGGTKCEVEFIKKTLDDAYASGMSYDVSDMEHDILVFGMQSSHHSQYCVELVSQMKFMSKDIEEKNREDSIEHNYDMPVVVFDCEIYRPTEEGEVDRDGKVNPGLFLICWKEYGEGNEMHVMVNPKPHEIEELLKYRLIGFNNLNYDNVMLYYASQGYTNLQLYDLSYRLINSNAKDAIPYESRKISYSDVYDYASEKKGLKRWEIDLGCDHIEMEIPWDEPAPRSMWDRIIEYCSNDVLATEKVIDACKGDFIAREILAKAAKGTVNDRTNTLTTKFIFNGDRNPELVYTKLESGERSDGKSNPDIIESFPGYKYVSALESDDGKPHNMYRGVDLGFGGYSYSEKGIYSNVALIDIVSLHPSSIVAMNYFGKYTQRFKDILDLRVTVKHHDLEKARNMFNGQFAEYLNDDDSADALAQALKIAINSCYGLTSAGFDNAMRDKRNVNNIVALRGALFMKTLLDELQSMGWTVCHLKVDSMKIPNATPEIIEFCMNFAKKYGYTFDHEATYERICLIDKAQYVAAYMSPEECEKRYGYVPSANRKHFKKNNHPWTTTGDAFQHPYVFKTLFSGERPTFKDMCETKTVRDAAMYLDTNEGMPDVKDGEKELERRLWNDNHPDQKAMKLNPKFDGCTDDDVRQYVAEGHCYQFVGRAGSFFPVRNGVGGGWLMARRNGKYSSVNGTKGYRWMESIRAVTMNMESDYSHEYFDSLIAKAIENANSVGSFDRFVDLSRPYEVPEETDIYRTDDDSPPWSVVPCGDSKYNTCMECPFYKGEDICEKNYSLSTYIEKGD